MDGHRSATEPRGPEALTIVGSHVGQDQRESVALRILNLEDNPVYVELVQAHLAKGGLNCELTQVRTRADFAAALENGGFDLVIADYAVSSFDGLKALEMTRRIRPELPLVFVADTLDEESVIEALKSGATDYVLKQRLERLVPAVRRAVSEAEERRERERIQEVLRRSEQQFRTLVEQIPAVTYTQQLAEPGSTRTNPTLYASPQIESQSGYPSQAFVEDSELWIKLLHPEDRERVLAEDKRTDETGEPFRMEYRQIARDGRITWIRDEAVLVRDEEGVPRFWQGVMFDITERKETERALHESEQRFRTLVQNSSDVITVVDAEGTIRYVSPAVERVAGYHPEDLVGNSVFDYVRPENFDEAQDIFAKLWSQPGIHPPFEFKVARKDGSWNHSEFLVNNLLDDPDVRAVVINQRDMTERKRTEEELKESEERFRSTFEQAAVGMAHVAPDGYWLRVNGKLCEIVGYDREELLGMTFQDLTHPEDLDNDLEQTRTLLAGEIETHSMEKRFLRKDGSVVWVNLTASLARGTSGEPAYFISVIEDISGRKRAEKALRESEERFRLLAEKTSDLICLHEPDGRYLYLSPSCRRLLDYDPEELLGKDPYTLFHPEDAQRIRSESHAKALEGEAAVSVPYRIRRKSGEYVWFETLTEPILDEAGEVVRLQTSSRDISERKEAEERLQEAEARYRTLVEQIPAVTYIQELEHEGSISYISPQIEDIMGYSSEEYVQDPDLWVRTTHPDDRERVLAEDRRTDRTGEPFSMEFRKVRRDGRVIWVRDEAVLVRDAKDHPLYWQGIFTDISERRRTEEALRESEERFRTLVQYGSDVITILEADGTIRYESPAVERLLGYRPEELVGTNVFDYIHPDDLERALNTFLEGIATDRPTAVEELRFRHADGSWRCLEAIGVNLLNDPAVRGIMVNSRDVTERKEAEEALHRSEAGLAEAQRIANLGNWEWDVRTGEAFWSEEVFRIYGYQPKEIVPTLERLIELVHPDDRGRLREAIDGALYRDEPYDFEHRIVRANGEERIVHRRAEVVRGEGGEPLKMVGTVQDITERKRTEEALKQSVELYRTVIEQAAESIFLVDVESKRILEVNASLARVLGYAPDELKEITLYDVVADDRESVDSNIRRILRQKRYSIGGRKYRRKDGSLVDVEVNVSVVPYGGKETMCIVAHDVTTHKQIEKDLRRSLSILLALREAGEVLSSTLESEEIVTRLLEIMQGVSGLTAAVISLRPPSAPGNFRIWRSVGLEALWPGVRFAPGAENARRAALENQEQRLVRLRRPGVAEDESLEALYLPLKVKDRVVGVMEAYGPESLARTDVAEVLSSLTSQAASALENAQLYEELAERERALQDLVGKLMGAQEEERRRVAYEVHDSLAQVAVAAHQHLQAFARRHSPDAERGRRDLERILELVRGTVSDARRIIANLRPTTLDDLGLAATISLEVERLREEGYRVEYADDIGEERLPGAVEIALFRVAQEALTNMRKHARTRWVRIELRREAEEVRLEVEDDGRGFDPAAASLGSGPGERVGLAGMRERIGTLGGALEVRSSRGAGTLVAASVPLTRAP